MPLKTFLSTISLLGILLYLQPSLAQSPVSPYGDRDMENIDIENAYRTPLVYVMSVTDVTAEDGQIRGAAELLNADELGAADIGYRVEIVGTEVDANGESLFTFWRGERVEVGALAPEERRAVTFAIPTPALPGGSYLIRVQILTSQGRPYGWGDAPITLEGAQEARVKATGIIIKQYGDDVIDPLSGPNIDPSTTFTITATVTNVPHDMTVIPILSQFDFDSIHHVGSDIRFEPVSLKKGQEKKLSYVITSRENPGVTLASLILTDPKTGKQLSPLADFRWVIRGENARVMAIRPLHLAKKKGDDLKFRIDMVGSPDAESVVSGTITLAVKDDIGTAVSLVTPFTDLKDGILSGNAILPLTRNLSSNPQIEAMIQKNDGTVLHIYTVPLAFSDEGEAILEKTPLFPASWSAWLNITSVLVAVAILVFMGIILAVLQRKGA